MTRDLCVAAVISLFGLTTLLCAQRDLTGTRVPSGGPHLSLSLLRSKEREEIERERERPFERETRERGRAILGLKNYVDFIYCNDRNRIFNDNR